MSRKTKTYFMKKSIFKFTAIVLAVSTMTSCATVFGGEVRVGALIANILLFAPGLIVDFATGAAYKPCDKK
jgi:hypothetical protein